MATRVYRETPERGYVLIQPNRSLSWGESLAFFVGTALIGLVIAIVFALKGLWMILPFTGLELLALGSALYLVARSGMAREVVRFDEQQVAVEFGRARRGPSGPDRVYQFARAWTRVRLEDAEVAGGRSRLTIGASGERVEIGRFLPEPERDEVARHLRMLLN